MFDSKAVHDWLKATADGRLAADVLFARLAQHLPEIDVALEGEVGPYGLPVGSAKIRESRSWVTGTRSVHLFTQATGKWRRRRRDAGQRARVLTRWVLQTALRDGIGRLIVDPDQVGYRLNREQMRELFREYAVVELIRMGGAWVADQNKQPSRLPVYLSREEAESALGVEAVFYQWDEIGARCKEADMQAPVLQQGHPEHVPLLPRHVEALSASYAERLLARLERALESEAADARSVCEVLAVQKEIWTLTDREGDIIRLGPLLDLFTSRLKAERFITFVTSQSGRVGPVQPCAFPTMALFRRFANTHMAIGINRCTRSPSFGPTITVTQVLRVLSSSPNG